MPIRPRNRDEMLAATPDRYLAEGWTDGAGRPWPEVRGAWASAAAQQWLAAKVAVQEVEITYEAFNQVLPYYPDAAARVADLAAESLALARGVMDQPNHPSFVAWMEACLLNVHHPRDGEAFMAHFKSALLQYALTARTLARGR